MTLKELKEAVDHTLDNRWSGGRDIGDIQVRIYDSGRSIGAWSSTGVKSANQGIDWDSGTFLIWPEKPLVRKPKNHEQKLEENDKIIKDGLDLYKKKIVRDLSKICENSLTLNELRNDIRDYLQRLGQR